MRRMFIAYLLLMLTFPVANAHEAPSDAECRKVKQQIDRIHSRMRAGYRAKTGVRLAARLRELQRRRARVCR